MMKDKFIKCHICFVAPKLYPVLEGGRNIEAIGGAEVQQALIARNLVRLGYKVSVVSYDYGQPDEVEVGGIKIYKAYNNAKSMPVIRNVYPRLTSIYFAMKRADADIYFQRCAGAYTGVVGAFTKINRRLFIYSGASDRDFIPSDLTVINLKRDRALFSFGLRQANAIVVQNKFQSLSCKQWYARDSVHIPNSYTVPADLSANENGPVLWVGVMRKMKRPHLFLELAKRLPHVRFRMIGGRSTGNNEADYFDQIKEMASKLENVEMLGYLPYSDAERYYNDARLFVSTSEYEGFPNTFLQSWSRGVPTVSFVDCGAEWNGKPVGNIVGSLDELAIVVNSLWSNELQLEMESKRAKEYFIAVHSEDVVVSKYEHLISSLISQRIDK